MSKIFTHKQRVGYKQDLLLLKTVVDQPEHNKNKRRWINLLVRYSLCSRTAPTQRTALKFPRIPVSHDYRSYSITFHDRKRCRKHLRDIFFLGANLHLNTFCVMCWSKITGGSRKFSMTMALKRQHFSWFEALTQQWYSCSPRITFLESGGYTLVISPLLLVFTNENRSRKHEHFFESFPVRILKTMLRSIRIGGGTWEIVLLCLPALLRAVMLIRCRVEETLLAFQNGGRVLSVLSEFDPGYELQSNPAQAMEFLKPHWETQDRQTLSMLLPSSATDKSVSRFVYVKMTPSETHAVWWRVGCAIAREYQRTTNAGQQVRNVIKRFEHLKRM